MVVFLWGASLHQSLVVEMEPCPPKHESKITHFQGSANANSQNTSPCPSCLWCHGVGGGIAKAGLHPPIFRLALRRALAAVDDGRPSPGSWSLTRGGLMGVFWLTIKPAVL